jgi:hypothetical protein
MIAPPASLLVFTKPDVASIKMSNPSLGLVPLIESEQLPDGSRGTGIANQILWGDTFNPDSCCFNAELIATCRFQPDWRILQSSDGKSVTEKVATVLAPVTVEEAKLKLKMERY